ncbi:MAG: beta-propeller fold lactonase family protein [Verrucomicrobiota bacterium]|nr:beta-propeller fold lactonase family protein [Verrucomicrobiota bacterium]
MSNLISTYHASKGFLSQSRTRLVLASLFLVTAVGFSQQARAQTSGATFAMTNRAANNQVVAFNRAPDGTLTEETAYSTGGNGIGVDFDTQGGLTLSADHRYLYACNPGSDDVTVFAVNGASLNRIQKVAAGDQPLSITLSGGLAYVLDGSVAGNGVTGFTVGADGKLTPIPNSFRDLSSPIAVPGEVQFSPDGRNVIVTGKVGSIIDVFNVRADGRLSKPVQNDSFGPRPFAAAFRNDGRLLVLESGLPDLNNSAVSSYDLLRPSGNLSVITGSEKNDQTDACWIVITNNQEYAYTANFVSGTISSYALGNEGTVSLINGAAAFSGLKSQPTDLAFDTETNYLYNLLRGTGGVSAYRVEADGSLTFLGLFGVGGALPVADGASGLAAY